MRKKSYKKQYFIKTPHVTVLALLSDALPLKYFLFPDQIHNTGKSLFAIKESSLERLQNEARDLTLAEFPKPKCHFRQVSL